MRKTLSYLIVVFITGFLTFLAFEFLQGNEPENTRAITLRFQSEILKEERELIIHFPRLYDSAKKYPVFYVLDGGSLDQTIADKLEVLSSLRYVPESIVIGIPNMTAESRDKNLVPPFMHTNHEDENSSMGRGDVFLKFLEEEVLPFVENQYPVTTRAFCGNSRGGLLVMYSLIKKPYLFDTRICFSTPFWREDDILIDSVKNFLTGSKSPDSFLFISAGSDETDNIRSGYERIAQAFVDSNVPKVRVMTYLTPKAIHADNAKISSAQAIDAWGKYKVAYDSLSSRKN